MSQSSHSAPVPDHTGSYDDLPDEDVRTVLAVPLAWVPASGAHPPGDPPDDPLRDQPPRARRRHARTAPRPRSTTPPNYARSHRHGGDPRRSDLQLEIAATLRVGLISAA
ncbi:MAG TPA: hypothetical protein VMT88_12580, partial [Actinomycetes bacterium]|nr:hypothetical protein [Actinomycetes bacterium]